MFKKSVLLFLVSLFFVSTLSVASPAYASESEPPQPLTVTSQLERKDKVGAQPDGVVSGPGTNRVTITNRYYPLWQGKVKTDGDASGNFSQPAGNRFHCESRIYNYNNQSSPTKHSYGDYGGTNCPTTPIAEMSTVVPATLVSYTSATWRWSNYTSGSGEAEQTNYQP